MVAGSASWAIVERPDVIGEALQGGYALCNILRRKDAVRSVTKPKEPNRGLPFVGICASPDGTILTS